MAGGWGRVMPSTDLTVPLRLGYTEAGEVAIITADQQVALSDASNDQIAMAKQAIKDWRVVASATERIIDAEVTARMDRRGLWTIHTDAGTLSAPSPAPSVGYRDLPDLRLALEGFVLEGLLDQEAVDEALPLIPEQVGLKRGALDKLAKLSGPVGARVRAHREEIEKTDRRVQVK